jgi:hypothetical protein
MEGDVGPGVVQPIADPLGELLPVLLVREDRCLAHLVESGNTQLLDLRLSTDPELPLRLDLHREAVGVPACDAGNAEPLHRPMPAYEVFQRSADDVVETRPAIRRGGALVEDEGMPFGVRLEGLPKEILLTPGLQHLLFQLQQVLR